MELYTKYEFGRHTKFENGRHNVRLESKDGCLGMTRGMGNAEVLVDVSLILHVKPVDASLIHMIAEGLRFPKNYLSLGRHEDLLRIDSAEIVDVEEIQLERSLDFPYDAYVPIRSIQAFNQNRHSLKGSVYHLNKKYVIDPVSNIRTWDRQIPARYAVKDSMIEEGESVCIDLMGGQKIPVFFA